MLVRSTELALEQAVIPARAGMTKIIIQMLDQIHKEIMDHNHYLHN